MTTKPGYVWDDAASEFVAIGQAAVLAPIAYQASQPSSPATGDIWIDSDDEVPSVDSTLYYRWTKTMSGGETSLSGNDDNSLSLQYTPGYESVFINGVLQVRNLDYTATSGSTIAGLTALASDDVVMVESIVAYSVGDTYTQSQMTSLLDAKSPVSTTGLVLLNTTTVTAQSTVSFNNAFTSTYDNYRLVVQVTGTTTAVLNIRFRVGGVDTSSSIYKYGQIYVGAQASLALGSSNNITANFIPIGYTANGFRTGMAVDIHAPNLTQRTSTHGTTVGAYLALNGGILEDNIAYDGFTLSTGGTITGTIKVYGYK